MKNIFYTLLVFVMMTFCGCNGWLQREPNNFLSEDQLYESVEGINMVVAGLYDRLPDWAAINQDLGYYTHFDEGMLGQNVNNFVSIDFGYASYYDYVLIRDINSHIEALNNDVSVLTETEKKYYVAEARFLRAYTYFEMVKRMGGVPLIKETMPYDPERPLEEYQIPRSSEAAIYDFIASEIDQIKDDLALTPMVQYTRASKGAALALKSRAMLYAATTAKYNGAMLEPIILPNGEVGIDSNLAKHYFEESLNASEEVIGLRYYQLYDQQVDKSLNFYEALTKPGSTNLEVIFSKEFNNVLKPHDWTYLNLPRTQRDKGFSGNGGAFINPSLNLVDAFDMKDGSSGKLIPYTDPNHRDESGNDAEIDGNPAAYIYYESLLDIFENKDPRLAGTILTPGSSFGGKALDLKAGVAYYDKTKDKLVFYTGSLDNYPEGNVVEIVEKNEETGENDTITLNLTGQDGPANSTYCTRTGFYVRKYLDQNPSAEGKKSGIHYVRYRYAEILLNAAEAAFELGDEPKARGYLKTVRDRAGVETSETITLEQIRNERRVEFAFEGQRYFDVKRWRVAEELFNADITNPNAMIYGLWPYKVYRPGHETHDKWIYVRRIPSEFKFPRNFVRANYYSSFSTDVLSKNPKLIKNPGH